MSFLKETTWDLHLRLEKRLKIKDRFSGVVLYREHLVRLWGFYAAAEKQWGGLLAVVLDDYPMRRKAPLLARDVEALGGAVPAPLAAVPYAADAVAALGGQHFLPVVERKLGLSAIHGASYLASYGPDVRLMWLRFREAVEAQCSTPKSKERAGTAGRETFLALETWLCRDLA